MLPGLNRCLPRVPCGKRRIFSSRPTPARSAIVCGSGKRKFWCNCWSGGSTDGSSSIASTLPAAIKSSSIANAALHCGISLACIDHHFLLLALLVLDVERTAIRRHQFDFYLVKFAVAG